jgi:uncharacterized protein RhaS with RHS repeats
LLTSLYLYEDEGYEPLARVDGTGPLQKIRYYHNDLNGLPEQLTEADGHNVWQATYRVWGNTLEEVREPYYIEEQNLGEPDAVALRALTQRKRTASWASLVTPAPDPEITQ